MQAPKIPSVFRNVKRNPKQFRYRNKYYDDKNEDFEERKARIEREVALERGEDVSKMPPGKRGYQKSWSSRKVRTSAGRSANLRLIIILIVLLAGVVYVLKWLDSTLS